MISTGKSVRLSTCLGFDLGKGLCDAGRQGFDSLACICTLSDRFFTLVKGDLLDWTGK